MKRIVRCFVGGMAVVCGAAAPMRSALADGYERAFASEEWEIIMTHGFSSILDNVVAGGGSGRDRWVLLDFGTDEYGNRYLVDSRETNMYGYIPVESLFDYETVVTVLIDYSDPTLNGGLDQREETMVTACHDQAFGVQILGRHDDGVYFEGGNYGGYYYESHYTGYYWYNPTNTLQRNIAFYGCRLPHDLTLLVNLLEQGPKVRQERTDIFHN